MNHENQTNQDQTPSAPPQDQPVPGSVTNQPPVVQPLNDVQKNKVWAVLGYIWVISIVVLLVKKDSPYAHYHAKQGTALFVLSLALNIIGWILPWFFLGIIISLLQLGIFILVIIGIINAASAKQQPVPLIGNMVQDM